MENQAVRQPNGDYRVESSGGSKFYHIEMFGQHAASCECAHFRKGHHICKHMEAAELAEKAYQEAQQGASSPPLPPLNGDGAFSLLRK